MASGFLDYVARLWPTPEDALREFLPEAAAAAAEVGAQLSDLPDLDGRRTYLPSTEGKRDERQYVRAHVEQHRDGTRWAHLTFGTFRHGGMTRFWSPRDLAWQAFQRERGHLPANDNNAAADYLQRAEQVATERATQAAAAADLERERHAAGAAAAAAVWAAAAPADGHPYLLRKGLPALSLRVATTTTRARLYHVDSGRWIDGATVAEAGELLIPFYAVDGELVNLERIRADGRKRPVMGARRTGTYHRIEGTGRNVLAEGWATSAAWHVATGENVIACGSAGNLAAVAALVQADAVAADHDRSGSGQRVAAQLGLQVHLPHLVGDDWADVFLRHGSDAIRVAVMNDSAPVVADPWKLPAIELKGRSATWFNKLGKAATVEDAAAIAWAIACRMSVRVPAAAPLANVLNQIQTATAPGMMNPRTLQAIESAIVRRVEARKRRALGFLRMTPAALSRHRVETVEALPDLRPIDYIGAILVNSPMGSGKTKHIGRPFAQWAAPQGFLATCHRVSLVGELARVMGADHYQEIDGAAAVHTNALASCLNSLVKAEHAGIIDRAKFVFVDEIAQVLRAVAGSTTVASGKTRADMLHRLREIIGYADCIIGADAGMDDRVVRFLESCRPGERFRVIRQPHRDEDLRVTFGYGPEARTTAIGEALARLSEGERLWVACGEAARAELVAEALATGGHATLLLTGENRDGAAQAAFWRDPEGESRKYAAVVASPVVSSGLSIEHHGAPHFTHGIWIGSGAKVTPADAMQQLRRVRYLRSWTVAVTPNNAHDLDNVEAILAGMEEAAVVEGLQACPSSFDEFVAEIDADNARARADFAAGLWWALEWQGFNVERMEIDADAELAAGLSVLGAELRERKMAAILAAPDLSETDARRLRDRPNRAEDDNIALLRFRIRDDLGLDYGEVDRVSIEAWDDGRGPRRWDRFTAMQGMADTRREVGELSSRRFQRARVAAYRFLFDGFDMKAGARITEADARAILSRVADRRFLLAFLRLVPAKWGREIAPKMPAYPVREVGEIMALMGLGLRRVEGATTPTCHDSPLEDYTASGGKSSRNRFYVVSPSAWEVTAALAERRNRRRYHVEPVAPVSLLLPKADRIIVGAMARHLWPGSVLAAAPRIGAAVAAVPRIGASYAAWRNCRVALHATAASRDRQRLA